jgi:hypothetical protein
MLEVAMSIVVSYGIIGFFVFMSNTGDDEHFMRTAARGIFWLPLLIVGTSKEFWKLLKE